MSDNAVLNSAARVFLAAPLASLPKESPMNSPPFAWRPRLLRAALVAVLLLSASFVRGQPPVPPKGADEKPPPSKKAAEEDPPLPSKKPAPAKQVRVAVTAPSAEV